MEEEFQYMISSIYRTNVVSLRIWLSINIMKDKSCKLSNLIDEEMAWEPIGKGIQHFNWSTFSSTLVFCFVYFLRGMIMKQHQVAVKELMEEKCSMHSDDHQTNQQET